MQQWRSQFWSLHIDSFTVRLLHLIVPNFVSTLLEIAESLRIDLHHDDNDREPATALERNIQTTMFKQTAFVEE